MRMAAIKGMHLSPAKHRGVWLSKMFDYRYTQTVARDSAMLRMRHHEYFMQTCHR